MEVSKDRVSQDFWLKALFAGALLVGGGVGIGWAIHKMRLGKVRERYKLRIILCRQARCQALRQDNKELVARLTALIEAQLDLLAHSTDKELALHEKTNKDLFQVRILLKIPCDLQE